jgi:telomerase reverse transcriptase
LLRHYCSNLAHGGARSPADLATHQAKVSAFCRAIILRVFPHGFWGSGKGGEHNRRIILRNIHRFVRSRKGESLTLHDVLQDIHISAITWLRPHENETKMCQSDFNKRKEIFAELIYYLFDSFVIPLVRSNFHVTESNVHKNRLFYFRQDVWRQITEPTIAELKSNMFEEMKFDQARKLLASRNLGYSDIRLLPKATGFRPIANLRRRMQIWKGGKKVLGRSINSILTPVFKILNFEKV